MLEFELAGWIRSWGTIGAVLLIGLALEVVILPGRILQLLFAA